MKCRLCGEPGFPVKLLDGAEVYECEGDREQVEGLARLIADRVTDDSDDMLNGIIYRVALDAIRRANR